MNGKLNAYSLIIRFAENVIGELSLNKETGLLKLKYNDDWQQNGFAISLRLTSSSMKGARLILVMERYVLRIS